MYRTPELKIEIKQGMGVEEIHSLLASALEFPSYYGKNWDAFDECINDDDASNPPEKLIILGWDVFIAEHPKDAKLFWECIEDRKETKKPMEVLVSPRACPCCGYLTLSDWNAGSWEICPVCDWEDDEVQYRDPTYEGGANRESLEQARARYKQAPKFSNKVKEFRC